MPEEIIDGHSSSNTYVWIGDQYIPVEDFIYKQHSTMTFAELITYITLTAIGCVAVLAFIEMLKSITKRYS